MHLTPWMLMLMLRMMVVLLMMMFGTMLGPAWMTTMYQVVGIIISLMDPLPFAT